VTDDRDRDEAPVIKVTDKRRFAKLAEAEGPERPSASGSDEPGVEETLAGSTAELAEARAKADEYLQHLQRLQAEFDNYRKRVIREQTSTLELAAEPVMRRLLEVLDEFELALLHAHDTRRRAHLGRFTRAILLSRPQRNALARDFHSPGHDLGLPAFALPPVARPIDGLQQIERVRGEGDPREKAARRYPRTALRA